MNSHHINVSGSVGAISNPVDFVYSAIGRMSSNELKVVQERLSFLILQSQNQSASPGAIAESKKPAPNLKGLTPRETEVLTLIANGYSRREVGQALSISQNTAATHIAAIYRKLDVSTIAEATLIALKSGLIE